MAPEERELLESIARDLAQTQSAVERLSMAQEQSQSVQGQILEKLAGTQNLEEILKKMDTEGQ